MNSSYKCLASRRTLSRHRTLKVFQWQPRSPFISLSDNPPTTIDEKSREHLLNYGIRNDSKKKPRISAGATPGRRKRILGPPTAHNYGDQLEALFEDSLKLPPSQAKEIPQPITSVEPYMNADALRKMLANSKCSVGNSWKFFVEHFGAEAWRKGSVDQRTSPSYLHQTGSILFRKIVDAKRKDLFSPDLPTASEISKLYSQLGMLRCTDWVDMMLVLLEGLIKLDQPSPEDPIHKERVISDVIGTWNVVFRQVGKAQDYPPDGSTNDWSHVPVVSHFDAIQAHRRRGTQGLFALLVPMFPSRSLNNVLLPVVATATFSLLTKENITDKDLVQEASPLISALGTVLSIRGLRIERFTEWQGVPTSVSNFLRKSWSKTEEIASSMHSVSIERESESESRSLSSSIRTDLSFINKRLHDAMGRRDITEVDKLWADVAAFRVNDEPLNANQSEALRPWNKRGILTSELCNNFIMVYMAVRRPNSAIEVWNHMVKSGLAPNLKTWDAMMMGCKACRDGRALEDVWAKMQHLRVKPDVVCWTTRISGLIECHQVEQAMQALDEMGRLWLAAAKNQHRDLDVRSLQMVTDVKGAVKPTIETVNAAIAGLLRKRQPEAAHRVLVWASKFKISPNVITYNTLLLPLVRDGHTKEAMALLKAMQKDGVQADVATFTTILDETFRYSDDLTSEEHREIISNVFSEMEAAGVKANLHTYGKIIYQLLQSSKGDLKAVNAVMEHMAQQGLQPTTYIYTILVNHYFSLQPPDLDAVRNVIERGRLMVGSVDHIFWDRVIEGYARVGDTTTAMRFLGKLDSGGNRASWVTKQVLLTSLVQNDEWDVARTFVRNVKIDTGGPRLDHEMKGKEGQQRFWRLATELELLD